MNSKLSFLKLIASMSVFGTIGLFVKYVSAERGFVAFTRGIVGALFLLVFVLIIRKKPSIEAIRRNLPILLLSGAAIGINWILLFESYSYTTIAASTLCYYMAPVIVMLASPFLLGERISAQKAVCVAIAIVGALLVSGVLESGFGESGAVGCLLALGAAVFYATVIILNRKLKDITPYDMTMVQLAVAALTVLPYTLIAEENDLAALGPADIVMLLTVAILHTGIAYALYFSSIQELRTDTVAIFSYLDPVIAVVISVAIGEEMSLLMAIGAALILIALVGAELKLDRFRRKKDDGTEKSKGGEQ